MKNTRLDVNVVVSRVIVTLEKVALANMAFTADVKLESIRNGPP
jgi:hypothetical protein